jgi:hypothetical protein
MAFPVETAVTAIAVDGSYLLSTSTLEFQDLKIGLLKSASPV